MKTGIVLLLGAAVVVFYLIFNTSQSSGPLASQPGSILGRLFSPTSGSNPSPLTNRNVLPVNNVNPQFSQTPVGTVSQVGAGFASLAVAFADIFRGSPSSGNPSYPTPAMQATGQIGPTLSSATGGLLQGPTFNGTPLSVSSGWQPEDSVIANVDLVPPVDTTLNTGMNLDPTQISPLIDNGIGTLPFTAPPDIASLYPGYDSTFPPADTGVVSLPDATTPDQVLV
jgi:hypothetical protein